MHQFRPVDLPGSSWYSVTTSKTSFNSVTTRYREQQQLPIFLQINTRAYYWKKKRKKLLQKRKANFRIGESFIVFAEFRWIPIIRRSESEIGNLRNPMRVPIRRATYESYWFGPRQMPVPLENLDARFFHGIALRDTVQVRTGPLPIDRSSGFHVSNKCSTCR